MLEESVFLCLCMLISNGVFGDTGEVKTVSVKEGHPVTLHPDLTDIQTDDQILWLFGPLGTLIAYINTQNSAIYDNVHDFRDKLKLNIQNRSLTITNIRITDSGLYKIQINSKKGTLLKRFNVTVYDHLPIPATSREYGWIKIFAGVISTVILILLLACVMFLYKRHKRAGQTVVTFQTEEEVVHLADTTGIHNTSPAGERHQQVEQPNNMKEVDEFVLAEALTACLGVPVKLQSECSDPNGAVKLDVTDVLIYGLRDEATGPQLTSSPSRCCNSSSLPKEFYVIPDEFFDPEYDFDFTNMSESDSECTRGDEPYKRPYGWMRFALKVRDKYPDGNGWLGADGRRYHSMPGEWPVSYHGTNLKGAEGIIQSHYKAGENDVYGRGIYSTPDIKVAEDYSQSRQFTSQKNEKTYTVILQNRVKPEKREKFKVEMPPHKGKIYWLVPIPAGTSAEEEKQMVESNIRPYGLLLKKV